MFLKNIIYCSSGCGNILRVFSYEEDGCIVYSWRPDLNCLKVDPDGQVLNSTFVRIFNPVNDTDQIVLILKGIHEINNASLSPDRKAIAYTILEKKSTRRQQVYSVITKHNSLSGDILKCLLNFRPLNSKNGNEAIDSNPQSDFLLKPEEKGPIQKPLYKSFLAEVYPTSWSMKFNMDKFMFGSRAVFTNFLMPKVNGDIKITQYKVLFIMHREHIGIYSIDIEDLSKSKNAENDNFDDSQLLPRTRISNRPISEVICNHIVWSQWDPHTQQLYYINVVHKERGFLLPKPNLGGIPIKLTCRQFYDKLPNHKVFDISLDLGLSRFSLYSKSLNFHNDLDPTLTNKELNIRLLNFDHSGSMCLCWQEMTDKKYKVPEWHYSFVILNKDISIHYPLNENETCDPVSFYSTNQYLAVYCSGRFIHFYDVETMPSDKEGILNGLNHIFLSDEFFPENTRFSFEFLSNHMPEIPWDSPTGSHTDGDYHSDSSSQSSERVIQTFPNCFDQNSKTFFNIQFESLVKLFEHKSVNTQNRMMLTKHAVLFSQVNHNSTQLLNKVLDTVMFEPTAADTTAILAQLLIFRASREFCHNHHIVPHDMVPLFPTTPSKKILTRILRQEIPESKLVMNYHSVSKSLESEIEQYLATININNMYMATNINTCDQENSNLASKNINNPMWYKLLSACKCGMFTEYDLDSITEEISFLAKQFRSEESGAQCSLQIHLSTMFKRKFLDPDPLILNTENQGLIENPPMNIQKHKLELLNKNSLSFFNINERNKQSQNIMALTSEKLCDHLSACFYPTNKMASPNYDQLSKEYVHAQVCAVNHILTLMILKSGVGNVGDFKLHQPATAKEQQLLTALNQFQLVSSLINFPLPNGFQSFITCLTFRVLLAKFMCISKTEGEGGEIVVSEQPDIELFSEQLSGFLDRGLIEITDEFMAQSLEELGDKKEFSNIIQRLLEKHGRHFDEASSVASLLGLQQQWEDDFPARKLIDISLTELYSDFKRKKISKPLSPMQKRSSLTNMPNEISVKSYLRQQSVKKDSNVNEENETVVPNQTKVDKRATAKLDEGEFPALSAFFNFLTNYELDSSMSDIKLIRQCSSQPIADLVKSSFTEPTIIKTLKQQN